MSKPQIGIFGAHSYIGNSFADYAAKSDAFSITRINSRTYDWKVENFGQYDVMMHVAGIAHVSTKASMGRRYYEINRDLPIAVAQKAKEEGVRQFIFFSSMIVYEEIKGLHHIQHITEDSIPNPSNFYGKSKLEAEKAILSLQTSSFTVSVLRLPMVYGPRCKGNFPRLISLASRTPMFPDIENARSMIYIENLCEYLRLCILNAYNGILFPQNSEYVSTKDIISYAAKKAGHHLILTKAFNPLLSSLSSYLSFIDKVFGYRIYDKSLSPGLETYNLYSFEESMERYFNNSHEDVHI